MTKDDVHELAAAYALDALAADERKEFEAHLPGCRGCRDELGALQATVGALGLAAQGPEPAASLRDRILGAAREEPPKVIALARRRTRLYAATAVAVAACVALAVGLWLGLSGGSSGKLALSVSVEQGIAKLSVSGFRAAPPGKAYEIWVIEGKQAPRPAGLFTGGKTVVRLTRSAPAGSTVAVTLERASGAKVPTPPVLATTTVSA
jgi:anti-sigma-K factor RskA